MSDRFYGKISFVASISEADDRERIKEDLVGLDNLDPGEITGNTAGEYAEALDTLLTSNQVVTFEDSQAEYGGFDELEEILRELGIPYDRHSDGAYEYNAMNVYWRPGFRVPVEVLATQEGDAVVEVWQIKRCLVESEQLADQGRITSLGQLFIHLRQQLLLDHIPPLESYVEPSKKGA